MINKVSQKKNLSSMQVLKTLQLLIQGEYSMSELIEKLNANEPDAIFNNSVISKYINTCRYCGFEIPKINNKYYVAKIPFGLDLSLAEINIIDSIKKFVSSEMSVKRQGIINSLMSKIIRFSNKEIKAIEKNEVIVLTEIFERAVANNRKIKLMFKNRSILECTPLNVTRNGNKVFFNVYKNYVRNIDISRLSGIEIMGQVEVEPKCDNTVVIFKLKGGLAKRYEVREHEKIEQNSDGSITVTNRNENKEFLFSRLLRYDDKCEILQPKTYRDDMKKLIEDMLANYGEK